MIKRYPYRKVDAFTAGESRGNPAAYLNLEKDTLPDETMLSIAREHKGFVSEVVFCTASDTADIKLTYYASECEVAFCGHGTIAAIYDLICDDALPCKKPELLIETNRKGVLPVLNRIATDNAVFITAPEATWHEVPATREDIGAALGTDAAWISDDLPIDCIDAGLRTLIVPISTFEQTIALFPDEKILKRFCLDTEIDIVLIFSMTARCPEYHAHTRVFAPKFGYLEDPATGSGNSALGTYLLRNHLWDGRMARIEQGGNDIIYNEIKLLKQGNAILFGGKATRKIDGVYIVS